MSWGASFQYRQVLELDLTCDNACVFCSQSRLRGRFVVEEGSASDSGGLGSGGLESGVLESGGFDSQRQESGSLGSGNLSSGNPSSGNLSSGNPSSGNSSPEPPNSETPKREAPSTEELTLVGGEPSLLPDLAERIAALKKAGVRKVGLQTHGRHLANPALFGRLVDAGLDDLHLSIHGADAACHDFHVGQEGALQAVLKALALARRHKLPVVVNTVLTRSNYGGLGSLAQMLRQQQVAAWLISVPHLVGEAANNQQRVAPRLALALPFALQALTFAEKLGLPSFIRGAPLCLLGPYANRALPELEPRGFWEPACGTCAARPHCPGVDSAYLERFKGDELSPRSAVEAFRPRGPEEAELARMFVGPGRLSPREGRSRLAGGEGGFALACASGNV